LDNKIRVGIVSYLNTRPLVYGLKLRPISDEIELLEETPARLADLLLNNEIDIGLVPTAVIPQLKESFIASDYCIGTETEVASVCLFSEVPLNEIQKVYLDYESRSSAALLRWLMHESWGIYPEIVQAVNDSYRKEIAGTTAGLVIGDRAFEQRRISTFIYDLASEWRAITGLPFVFAAWISNRRLPDSFIQKFNDANSIGLNHIDEIVRTEQFALFDLKKYYTLHLSYRLDERKKRGMQLFLEYISLYAFLQ